MKFDKEHPERVKIGEEKFAECLPEESEERDLQLCRRVLSGETDAFGILASEYETWVYNIAFSIMNNREDALDVSQDSFIKAYRRLGSFRGDSRFSTWLYRIVVNTAKDALRARSRRRTDPLTVFDEDNEERTIDIPDEQPTSSPEVMAETGDLRDAVRAAIESLSEDHRMVITLCDIEGRTYEEIAVLLGVELGTVKSRLNRARNAVKRYLLKHNLI